MPLPCWLSSSHAKPIRASWATISLAVGLFSGFCWSIRSTKSSARLEAPSPASSIDEWTERARRMPPEEEACWGEPCIGEPIGEDLEFCARVAKVTPDRIGESVPQPIAACVEAESVWLPT